jgi:hypothetical protein
VGAKAETAGPLTVAANSTPLYEPSLSIHMTSRILIASLILISPPLHAAPRAWKSTDGQHSIQGEFLKRDASSVTILRAKKKEVTISFDKLHQDDLAWLDEHHPLPKPAPPPAIPVFDELRFGDKRSEVTEKLMASKMVELTIQETFLGRTGLNGVFRTRNQIGGLEVSLFFDWTEEGGLREITLQTPAAPAGKFNQQFKPCWEECIKLLTSLHGQPVSATEGLDLSAIPDGGMLPTHMWKMQEAGTALLGASREGDQYHVAIRFTEKQIEPIRILAPSGN